MKYIHSFELVCTNVSQLLIGLVKDPEQTNTNFLCKNAISDFFNRRIFLAYPGLYLQELETVQEGYLKKIVIKLPPILDHIGPVTLLFWMVTKPLTVKDCTRELQLQYASSTLHPSISFQGRHEVFRRGIDNDGHVANFNETEQIANVASQADQNKATTMLNLVSYVQIRGSVPVFWAKINTLRSV
jgi:hypothetical protein